MDNKTKLEQLFILAMVCIGVFGIFCLNGCGNKNACEKISYGASGKSIGISIPGCGGCLTSGKGCDSCIWPQSCKIMAGCEETFTPEGKDKMLACDTKYYGEGCLGCGQKEKSCYSGCFDMKSYGIQGCVYGSSDSKERVIGCYNGCCGCVGTNNTGIVAIEEMEKNLKIR